MKKTLLLWILLLLCNNLSVFAQNKDGNTEPAIIDGFVLEEDSVTPMDYTTVQLFSLPDSSFIKGVTSGSDGRFQFNLPSKGSYFLKLSSVGYNFILRQLQVVDTVKSVHLGNFIMKAEPTMLKGAEVVAQMPAVVQNEDTTTYNASAFQVAEGSALEDLIEKLPGAEIDEDGNLLINGQKITKVMMDGEEFFISDLNTVMKEIPADMIEKLQVYHRKSDKARMTGINDGNEDLVLDLRVKPDRRKGWNGNVMAGYGNDGQWQGKAQAYRFKKKMNIALNGSASDNGISKSKNIGINYSKRTDKWNVSANASFHRNDNDRWSISDTETFITDSTSQYSHAESQTSSFRNNVSANMQMEWRPDTLTTIRFRPQLSYNNGEEHASSSSWMQNNERQMINRKEGSVPRTSHMLSTSGDFYVNRRLGKPGRNLSFNFSYHVNNSDNNSRNQSNTFYLMYEDSVQVRNQNIITDNNSHEIKTRISYTEPVFKNHYLEIGYTFRNKPSVYEKYAYDWNDLENRFEAFADSAQSRCTENKYNIHQAGISFVANTEKYNYTLGLNIEAQRYSTHNYFENITVTSQTRTVVNYAPVFNLKYRFAKNTTLRMNYRGYSSQPSLNDLQPITDNTDPLNIRTGNPDLKPAFNNNVSVNFNQSFTSRRSSISASGSFNNQMNQVAWVVDYDESTGVRKNSPLNVNGNWQTSLQFNFYTPLGNVTSSKFSISTNSRYNFRHSVSFIKTSGSKSSEKNFTKGTTLYQQLKGNFHYQKYDANVSASIRYFTSSNSLRHESDRSTFDYSFRAGASIDLFWDMQLSSDVNCQIRKGYGENNDRTRTMWNAQLSKSFLKRKNFVVRFNLYDILHEREEISHSVSDTSIRDSSSSTSKKYFMFSLTYKFNKFGPGRGQGRQKQRK